MLRFFRLLLRRALIFSLVLGLAYFTVFFLFPYIDDRLPSMIAVLITYGVLAYIAVPALIRVLRVFDEPRHIPLYNTTSDGWPSDPVNIAVLATSERDFIWAMEKAGWYKADEGTLANLLREGYAMLFNRPYPTAPFSKLYLFGRKQDLGFQIPVGKSPRHRHHVRFWKVTHESLLDLHEEHDHKTFWQKLFKKLWHPKQQLWVGAAIYDSGPVAIRWRNGQITHQVHPDANFERDFIIDSLREAKVLKDVVEIKAGAPYRGRGQTIGMTIISDGFVKVCELKRQLLPPHRKAVQESMPLKRRVLRKIKQGLRK